MADLISIFFQIKISMFFASIFINKKMNRCIVDEVSYGCVRSLDGRKLDWKLAMHANCFNEIWKNMIQDLGSRQNGIRNRSDVSSLNKLKSCCHHSIQDLFVHTDCAWCRLKKYCHQKGNFDYPDRLIKFIYTVCILPLKVSNDGMVYSHCSDRLFS